MSLSLGVGLHALVVLVEPASSEAALLVRAPLVDAVAARPAGQLPTPHKTARRETSPVASASEIWREILTANRQHARASLIEPYRSRVILAGPADRAPPPLSA